MTTLLPRGDLQASPTPPGDSEKVQPAVHNERRQAFNTMLRDGWPEFADALVDVAAEADFASTDSALFADDLTHLSDQGKRRVAALVRDAVLALETTE